MFSGFCGGCGNYKSTRQKFGHVMHNNILCSWREKRVKTPWSQNKRTIAGTMFLISFLFYWNQSKYNQFETMRDWNFQVGRWTHAHTKPNQAIFNRLQSWITRICIFGAQSCLNQANWFAYTFLRLHNWLSYSLSIRPIDQQTIFCAYLIECKFLRSKLKRKLIFLSLRFSLSLASRNNFFFHH